MRRLPHAAGIVTLAATAAMACSDARPVAPPTQLGVADREAASLQVAIDDIRTRVLPALGDSLLIGDLSRALGAVTSALRQADPTAYRTAITRAEDALGALSARSPGGTAADADLDVVRLALDDARSMIPSR